jgi:hypothetical protein
MLGSVGALGVASTVQGETSKQQPNTSFPDLRNTPNTLQWEYKKESGLMTKDDYDAFLFLNGERLVAEVTRKP